MSDPRSNAVIEDLDRVTVDPATGTLCHVPVVEDGLLRLRQWDVCRVCGAELLTTSSRWSLVVCLACKKRVLQVNRQLGRCLVPIGRHSIVNGAAWRPTPGVDPRTDPTLRGFVDRFADVSGGVLRLDRWGPAVVRRACRELGFDDEVGVAGYLRHARVHIDKQTQLEELLEWLAAGAKDEGLPA